jgi:esterase/lipase superfamily enzyme
VASAVRIDRRSAWVRRSSEGCDDACCRHVCEVDQGQLADRDDTQQVCGARRDVQRRTGAAPAFADITVSIPPNTVRKEGEVAWPKRLPSNPATDFATVKADDLNIDEAKRWLSASVRKSPDHSVLVFIHGFNNRFEDSVYRFAQIVEDSGVHSAPVLVTWPSRGSLLAYGYDRESTNYTRNALETLFQYLAKDPEVKEVSILAHSMGNWLALESLRQMAIRNGWLPAKFKNVMLAAPDVDVDVFRQQIGDMGKQRPQFTLFVSRDDRALAFSRRVWGDVS